MHSDSGDTLLAWAVAGLGLAVLPTFIASDAIRSGAVEPILLDYPMPTRALYVVRPPGAYVPGKVRVLIDLLVERFGGTPYWDPCQMEAHRARLQARRAAERPAHACREARTSSGVIPRITRIRVALRRVSALSRAVSKLEVAMLLVGMLDSPYVRRAAITGDAAGPRLRASLGLGVPAHGRIPGDQPADQGADAGHATTASSSANPC